jgi:hypothetical protein
VYHTMPARVWLFHRSCAPWLLEMHHWP